jgi:anti-anti-sigma regulatory factor
MIITSSKMDGRVPVTVLHLHGDLDASNYTDVIREAQEMYRNGARHLIVDLTKVPFMSSAGLMALHTVALIFAGQAVHNVDSGRPSFRALDPQRDGAAREHVKLLSPQSQVDQVLETVGLKQIFEVYADVESAVGSF